MARLPRLSIGGQLHLVIKHVQADQPIFADAGQRRDYLACLQEAASRSAVAIHAYGLSPAEVRLLATPPDALALGRMVQFIGRRFGNKYNRTMGRRGSLWEGRFRSTVVEAELHFFSCLRFVEQVQSLGDSGHDAPPMAEEEVPWSSNPHHAGLCRDPLVSEHPQFWTLGNTPFDRDAAYRRLVQSGQAEAAQQAIAAAAMHGWALGSDRFVQRLRTQVERRLQPRSPGRPRVADKDSQI